RPPAPGRAAGSARPSRPGNGAAPAGRRRSRRTPPARGTRSPPRPAASPSTGGRAGRAPGTPARGVPADPTGRRSAERAGRWRAGRRPPARPPGRGCASSKSARSAGSTGEDAAPGAAGSGRVGGMTQLDRLIRAGVWDEVRRRLTASRPFDVAEELTRLDGTDRALAFRLLPKDLAIEVFEALDPPLQGELLEGLRDETVRMFVAELDPDDRVELLDELPAKVVTKLLADLSPHERRLTTELLGYPADAVGRVMSPEYVALKAGMTAGQALERVRQFGPAAETVYTLPVIAEDRRLIGITSLRRLVLARPEVRVSEMMNDPISARALTKQETASRLLQEADLLALPIVDAEERLVGVFTVDDAMEVLEGAETED